MEIIRVGHIDFLVKVELMWVQDPGSSPKSSRSLPSPDQHIEYKLRGKVAKKLNNHPY